MTNTSISLTDILDLGNLNNVKIRFNKMFDGNWDPAEIFKNGEIDRLLNGQYWNYKKQKSFKHGHITLGFIALPEPNRWLLFHVGKVTKDLDILNGMGYEYESIPKFEKYLGRLVIRYENKHQNLVRLATSVIDKCEVSEILPSVFDTDIFPGYDQVNVDWGTLRRVITKEGWIAALRNQKGIYLLTDTSNGKMYVGSAYGENMILGRWTTYLKTGHGGNTELRKLGLNHIRSNFKYSILEIFKSTTDDNTILARETWWKNVLASKKFGYNGN